MNPSYRDKLTDLGISYRVVEEIQRLNKAYLHKALAGGDSEYADYHLETEEFIK